MSARPHHVTVVTPAQQSLFELAAAVEVFGTDRRDITPHWYTFDLVGSAAEVSISNVDATLVMRAGLDRLHRADTLVIAGWYPLKAEPDPVLVDAVVDAHRRGVRLVAICSGAFVLAAGGLLDDRTATTHWMHTDLMRERYPRVRVDRHDLYIDHGDVATSAGSAAGIDLCLHIVRTDFGVEVANEVARRMVVAPHRSGAQPQWLTRPVPMAAGDPLADAVVWLQENLAGPVDLAAVARRCAMSERTLNRRFRAMTGMAPKAWLTAQRILEARRLLETTDLPLDAVAARSGLRGAENLRRHFRDHLDISPGRYRARFRPPGGQTAGNMAGVAVPAVTASAPAVLASGHDPTHLRPDGRALADVGRPRR
jgi:AraC family transcriptional activator FtrA